MRNKKNALLVTLSLLAALLIYGAANADAYLITNIEIVDNAVKIKIEGPIKYTIHTPADPFKVSVDIEGVRLGKFKDKIYSDRIGITEITPAQIEMPAVVSRLDILLQAPAAIKPEIKGDTLVISLEPRSNAAGREAADKIKEPEDKKMSLQESKPEIKESPAKEIAAVVFDKSDDGIEIIIKGDGKMPEPAVFELDGRIMIDISGIEMKASLPSKMLHPVKDIKYKAEKEKVRFTIDIDGKVMPEVFAMDDEVVIEFAMKQKQEAGTQKTPNSKLQTPNSNLVSLDFQDADVVPILRLLGDVSGYNIVIHPDVKGKISMKLLSVPWEQALEIILKTFGLEKIMDGNVIRIVTLDAIQKEKDAVAKAKEATGKAEDVETKVYVLNYSNIEKVKEAIVNAKVLSPRGSIGVDTRTRSLIIKDIPSIHEEIQTLISSIDKATPQVLIEARIVEMNTNFAKDIGVQWGAKWIPPDSRLSLKGSQGQTITGGQGDIAPALTNLPVVAAAPFAGGPTSAVTIGYLNAAKTFGLDLRLSAAETVGKAKIISSPKIVTLENERAEIIHGTQIPVVTPGTTTSPPTVSYKDANLKLVVTPSVTPDGTVFLNVEITNDVPDFTPARAIQGNVPIDKREAKNKVLVKDGETVVIGGILKTREDDGKDSVPGFSKIPLLGWLFKREIKKTESSELLIFITPRIVKQ
ncbi:MAG: type IV pilus secretin PilQ [Nitrospirae bacterium]|nr:type IV pilus secretin PilQ [Nitrospirota bacterium]